MIDWQNKKTLNMKIKTGLITRIILTFFWMLSINSFSQDINKSNLRWEANEFTDLQTSSKVVSKCTFRTLRSNTVEWIQKKGTLTSRYKVVAVDGSWPNLSKFGSLTYLLDRNGKTCRMTMERNESGIFITMDLSKTQEYVSRYKFKIESVN